MKIVFVQSGLGAGGAEKIVNLLAQHRLHLGDEVHVLAFRGEPNGSFFPYNTQVHVETAPVSTLAERSRAFRVASRLPWLRRRFKEIGPDVIVSFLTKTNVLVLMASAGLGIPVVVSERNNPMKQGIHPLWYPAGMILAHGAGAIVMQTEAAYDLLPKRVKSRALVIPNPNVIPNGRHHGSRTGNTIVAVGRLVQQKGFDLLIEAMARLRVELPEVRLIIFGDGPDRPALEARARALGIADRVSFPGVTEKPGEWLSAGDVFVLSSRYEGFPNVLVEALASGLPSVAFDCPWGPADILTHEKNGLLVPPGNVEVLADSLKRVLIDPAVRQKLSAAAPAAAARFSLNSVLASWDNIIAKTVHVAGREALSL
jgi:glycosyltransferase involved in cell wall biosynthesis